MTVSLLTAAGLYPTLRRREDGLLKDASTIAHNNIEVLALLGKLVELHDPDTNGHNLRVSLYSVMFCEALGLSPDILVRTTKGALLHDIGKIVIPDQILSKPGPLTPVERKVMQSHVLHGEDLVAQAEILNEAAPVVAGHHERFDGTGYPRGLKGKAIPLEARIFAIIDVFDALTSRRVYKPAHSVADTLSAMAGQSGLHFDPVLLDRFVELAPGYLSALPKQDTALIAMLKARLLRYFDRFTHVDPILMERDGTWLLDMTTGD
jgi:HD-GYP domain-containing protein (c-di-GMP phosphodiesterase class II)